MVPRPFPAGSGSAGSIEGKLAFFAGIDKARFRGQVLPGDTLRLEMEMIKNRGSVGIGKAVAYVGDKRVVTAELTFALSK